MLEFKIHTLQETSFNKEKSAQLTKSLKKIK